MKNSTARLCAPQLKSVTNPQLVSAQLAEMARQPDEDQSRFSITETQAITSRYLTPRQRARLLIAGGAL
jgi:hypothetical protein